MSDNAPVISAQRSAMRLSIYVSTNFKISSPWKFILAPENSPSLQFSGEPLNFLGGFSHQKSQKPISAPASSGLQYYCLLLQVLGDLICIYIYIYILYPSPAPLHSPGIIIQLPKAVRTSSCPETSPDPNPGGFRIHYVVILLMDEIRLTS